MWAEPALLALESTFFNSELNILHVFIVIF